ncbi:hypothetical protein [Emticicia sp. W12TSBA100-4]|uniref:hypothetical protein n=1 Tax=Emticicia sp. W12TSBA100-4 TaxID=3160965 RepID=UPI0033066B59
MNIIRFISIIFLIVNFYNAKAQDCVTQFKQFNRKNDRTYTPGFGSTRDLAIQSAANDILRKFRTHGTVKTTREVDRDKSSTSIKNILKYEIVTKGGEFFEFSVIDSCKNTNGYNVLTEIFTPKLSKAALYSILPGAGQFYKGDNKMGTFFVSSVGTSLSLTSLSFALSNNFYSKAIDSRSDYEERKKFKRRSESFHSSAMVFGVTTGILWVANIVNARFKKQNNRLYSANNLLNKFEIKPAFAFNNTGISIKYNLN